MGRSILLITIVLVILFISLFGMPLMLSGHVHHVLCPFLPDATLVCPFSTLVHMTHWQSAFAAILLELVALGALAFLLTFHRAPIPIPRMQSSFRPLRSAPARPTLFQELFARGILHRKEPHMVFAAH